MIKKVLLFLPPVVRPLFLAPWHFPPSPLLQCPACILPASIPHLAHPAALTSSWMALFCLRASHLSCASMPHRLTTSTPPDTREHDPVSVKLTLSYPCTRDADPAPPWHAWSQWPPVTPSSLAESRPSPDSTVTPVNTLCVSASAPPCTV